MLISDAATGAAALKGALYGAAINVKVNTKLMKDREYASGIDFHIEQNLQKYGDAADKIFDIIYNNL